MTSVCILRATKKRRPVGLRTTLTVCRVERRTASYIVRQAARPRLGESRSGAEDSPSSPGQTSPTVSRPRETRPVRASAGPEASGNSRPGRFDPPSDDADEPYTAAIRPLQGADYASDTLPA
jgi:hypothetical protein